MFPKDNLLTFWKLDDLKDSRGNRYTLTNNGGVQFVAGKIGNCAEFNGTNWLRANVPLSFSQNPITISMWIDIAPYPFNDSNGLYTVFMGHYGFNIWINNQNVLKSDNYAAANNLLSTLSEGFSHIVLVIENGIHTLWVNGQQVYSGPHNYNDIPFFYLGAGYVNFLNPTQRDLALGKMDAVGIWNRALTLQEIQTLYNNGNGLE